MRLGILEAARSQARSGVRYSWGGGHGRYPGPSRGKQQPIPPYCDDSHRVGLDCSGLTRFAVFLACHVDVLGPGSCAAQFDQLAAYEIRPTDISIAHAGDIIFFDGHNAIYAGNECMIAATGHYPDHTGKPVTENEMSEYWIRRLRHIVRLY